MGDNLEKEKQAGVLMVPDPRQDSPSQPGHPWTGPSGRSSAQTALFPSPPDSGPQKPWVQLEAPFSPSCFSLSPFHSTRSSEAFPGQPFQTLLTSFNVPLTLCAVCVT